MVYLIHRTMDAQFCVWMLLFMTCLADNNVSITCELCSGNSNFGSECVKYNGAAFNNYQNPLNGGSTCNSTGLLEPRTVEFLCNSECKQCQIKTTQSIIDNFKICLETYQGVNQLNHLNAVYSNSIGDSSLQSEYQWCLCGASTGAVIGIALGSIAAIVAITIIAYCCCLNCHPSEQGQEVGHSPNNY